MDCRDASRAQSELLDHTLPAAQHVGLRLHLFLCKWCRRYGHQIRFLHRAAREHTGELTEARPHPLSDAARGRIKKRLLDQK
jgi:hypothetical protein